MTGKEGPIVESTQQETAPAGGAADAAAAGIVNRIPEAITTPDEVETRIGTLHFTDGMPSPETLDRVYDNLDFTHAFEAFVNALQGVNTHAMRLGYQAAGVPDNEFLIFSEMLDPRSLFLMGNMDTVYVGGFLDLTGGPLVLEAPPGLLGAVNDYWGGWVIDLGAAGPDRGTGGSYLFVPPGDDGPLPEGGFFVARPKTLHLMMFGRVFLQDGDPRHVSQRSK